jgi:hypothetical protein
MEVNVSEIIEFKLKRRNNLDTDSFEYPEKVTLLNWN